jgi:hypothetical protein
MEISKLARKPKLVKIELSDKDIVENYGDAITFWMIDEFGVDTYFEFYKVQQAKDNDALNGLLRNIILREDGSPAISEDEVLPVNIVLAVLVAINDFLGKSNTKPEEQTTGGEQS